MAKPFDLDAYLGRINYTGPRTPTYDTLAGILQAHIASIPFESFDVLLGRPIRLDPEGCISTPPALLGTEANRWAAHEAD